MNSSIAASDNEGVEALLLRFIYCVNGMIFRGKFNQAEGSAGLGKNMFDFFQKALRTMRPIHKIYQDKNLQNRNSF